MNLISKLKIVAAVDCALCIDAIAAASTGVSATVMALGEFWFIPAAITASFLFFFIFVIIYTGKMFSGEES